MGCVARPLFSPCRDRDVHRLVPDGTMVPGPGPPKSSRALRWTRRRSSIVRSTHPTEWTDTASGQINWSDCHSAELPEAAPPCSKNRAWAMLDETGADRNTKGL